MVEQANKVNAQNKIFQTTEVNNSLTNTDQCIQDK